MKRIFTQFISTILLGVTVASAQFDPCNWKYRKRITFDPARVSGSADLTDFPALIQITADNDLRTTGNSGHVDNANGFDIVFTAADGVTQLDHDLNSYDATTGALTCWVKLPTLSASMNTYIYMYYGNSGIATNQSSSSTWSNGYVGVWHFDNSLNNSTATGGLNGSNNGSTNSATSMFGSARNFDGTNDYVDVTPFNAAYNLTSDITVSCWVRLAATGADRKFAGNQNDANGGWKFGVFSDNKIEFEIRTSGNSPFLSRSAAGGSALAANTWYYCVGMYSNAGNFINTYRNGVLDRNYNTNATLGTSPGTMKFGREPFSNAAWMSGQIDEMRLSNVTRTAGWIATEYNNQSSPSTFYTISPEPKRWTAGSSGAWATNNNWTTSGDPTNGEDCIIANQVPARQPTLNTSSQIGSMWILPGATVNLGVSTRTLSVLYDITNCGVITGAQATLRLNTTTIQTQYLSGSGTYNLNNLQINTQFNTNPQVELKTDVNVAGLLTLSSGIVQTSSSGMLILSNGATSTSGSSQSYVSGPMRKIGNADFFFPVGKGQEWRRIGISSVGGGAGTTFEAEYFNTPFNGGSPTSNPLNNVSLVEHWVLNRISGGNARVSLCWENVAYSDINDCNDLTIARWNGSSWTEHTASAMAGSSCSGAGTGTVRTNGTVNAFSPFTFGSKSPAVNLLPVSLTEFSATCGGPGMVEFSWETAMERNNDYYTIEHSEDAVEFKEVARVKSQGDSYKPTHYTFIHHDYSPEIGYYRLKQTDFGGKTQTFKIVSASCGGVLPQIAVYPNPGSGEFIVSGIQPGSVLNIYSTAGILLQSRVVDETTTPIFIPEKGLYLVTAQNEQGSSYARVIVR